MNELSVRALKRVIRETGVRPSRGAARELARSLEEIAWEIAERGPMPLFQADVLLTRARLFGRLEAVGRRLEEGTAYPWGSAQDDLAEARRLIDAHGYHRRDEELADAEQALRAGPDSPPSSDPPAG